MKKIIGALLFLVASASHAGHLDVISFTLSEDCPLSTCLEIVDDFNAWAEGFGYQTEIAVPAFNSNLETIYWLGRSANAEVFGKACDAWYSSLSNTSSVPGQLAARFGEYTNGNDARNAYRTYP